MILPRALARFNRVVTNRIQALWAPHLWPWVVVVHRGRSSGREYRTPVFGTRRGPRLALAVMYGTDSDWVRNLLAAGEATVIQRDRTLHVSELQLRPAGAVGELGLIARPARDLVIGRITDGPGTRSFDPVRLGTREADAWVAYYRHEWAALLRASLALVDEGFGMGRARTVLGAWYVLRANQRWSPYPDNDPAAARECMRRFYALVRKDGALDIDPAEAARREVDWWRIHRIHQRENGVTEADLIASVAHLYSYVYSVPDAAAREAARLRVEAMRLSDEWVAAGRDPASPILAAERTALVDSYRALRAAVSS